MKDRTYAELLRRVAELESALCEESVDTPPVLLAAREFDDQLRRILGFDFGTDPRVVSDVRASWATLRDMIEDSRRSG